MWKRFWFVVKNPLQWTSWWIFWDWFVTNRTWPYLVLRWLQGARRGVTGCASDLSGDVHDDGIEMTFGGGCPVQGQGTIDGLECYYRSRGEGWYVEITMPDGLIWEYGECCYVWPDGGWLHWSESERNIRKAAAEFREREAA